MSFQFGRMRILKTDEPLASTRKPLLSIPWRALKARARSGDLPGRDGSRRRGARARRDHETLRLCCASRFGPSFGDRLDCLGYA